MDSIEELYQAHAHESLSRTPVLRTDGGRYDVNVHDRTRTAAYCSRPPNAVLA